MLKRRLLFVITFVLLVITIHWLQPTTHVIKYFPIDEEANFSNIDTSLTLISAKKEKPLLCWEISSSHDSPAYLNQDVGLLFQNGQLKGIQSKWRQEQTELTQLVDFTAETNSLYQAISYHHLELHQPSNQIKSNHQMSDAKLYVLNLDKDDFYHFEQPTTKEEQDWANRLDQVTDENLNHIWTTLINDYDIKRDQYTEIPLTDFIHYQEEPLPGLTMTDTRRIIAQLWEGLYKNYILPNSKVQPNNAGIMPLILLDHKLDHLIVLFRNSDGSSQQLIQKLSVN